MAEVTVPSRSSGNSAETERRTALVFGGGLAGIAASARLAESGWHVTLVEARSTLGGRVFSFTDLESGRVLDNGQHVIVGACTNLLAFLETIGARYLWHLQPRLNVAVYDRSYRLGRLYGVSGPAPVHLLPSFISYPHLSLLDKINATRCLVSIMMTRRNDPGLEDVPFYDWLRTRGQSERVISNLWNVLVEGTLNDNIRDVSASMGLMIVQDGLLAGQNTANVGYPAAPLMDALVQPAQRYLESLGVDIIAGNPVRCVNVDAAGVVNSITVGNGPAMRADAYVSAVPFWTLSNVLSGTLAESLTDGKLSNLRTSPIVNVHLRYDRAVMEDDFCYFLDNPLQWVFNSTRIFGGESDERSQSLSVSISAAWDYIDLERSDLASIVASEMSHAFPKTRDATLLNAVVVKQRNATFRCTPGANRFRPGPHTEAPNLFLAGEWTDTGWPSTMEGALISGYNAANAVMSSAATVVRSESDSVRSMG
ncbi:MAG: hydroxysqualene dehydroxylase HpnE [Chloroflexi bacterium]|nr:hydroxysqualene dehydroxylase HpnE [Chloroflexota bacterium]